MKTKKWTIVLLGVFVVLMGIFTFTDLQISQTLFNIQSPLGQFFEAFGEFPNVAFGALGFGILLFNHKSKKALGVIIGIWCCIMFALNSFLSGYMPMHYLMDGFSPWIVVIAAVMLAVGLWSGLAVKKLEPQRRESFRRVAMVAIWHGYAATAIIQVLKQIWGRVRFRELMAPFADFTSWFLPQFGRFSMYKDPTSFPSGHTAGSAVVFVIILFPLLFPALRNKKPMLIAIASVWVVLVALSRIIMGAHFASDVTMGAALSLVAFAVICRIIKIKELPKMN